MVPNPRLKAFNPLSKKAEALCRPRNLCKISCYKACAIVVLWQLLIVGNWLLVITAVGG